MNPLRTLAKEQKIMAQNKVVALSSLIYPIIPDGIKDEMVAFASLLLSNPDNYELNELESLVNNENIDELINGKFISDENEVKFKQIMSVVYAVMTGAIKQVDADIIVEKSEVKTMKENGALKNLKRSGTAGRFALFTIKDGNKD